MRNRLTVLMLLFVLPVMYPFDAPAFDRPNAILDIGPPQHPWDIDRLKPPEPPYALLDLGPPPKGKTAEEHCKEQIAFLTAKSGLVFQAWCDPEVQKLRLFESVRFLTGKDFEPWLEKTIRVTPENGGSRLRFTSRAGIRAEQAVIINALLRVYFRDFVTRPMKDMERTLRGSEEAMPRLAKDIKEARDVATRMRYQMEWDGSKARDADFRHEIARLKQVAIMKRAE